jgi:cytochrome c biogenesis protein
MTTALRLLLAVAAASVLGAFLPQRPSRGPTVAAWLAGTEGPGAGTAAILDALGLLDVFGSWWFLGLVALLVASLAGCLARRWHALAASLRRPPPAGRHLDRLRNSARAATALEPEPALAAAAAVLRRRRWRVRLMAATDAPGGYAQVAAERGRARETGSVVFHTALLVLLGGVAVAQTWGFIGQTDIAQGERFAETRLSYHELSQGRAWSLADHRGFLVTLEDVTALRYPDGTPADVAARVTVDGPAEVSRTAEVRVNEPLRHDGMVVYLARWGLAPRLTVRDTDGTVVWHGTVPLAEAGSDAWGGAATVPLDGGGEGELDVVLLPDATARPGGGFVVGSPRGDAGTWPEGLVASDPAAPLVLAEVRPVRPQGRAPSGVLAPSRDAAVTGPAAVVGLAETAPLGDGAHTLTFDRLGTWAGFQVSHQPGRGILLAGALLALAGLVPSLHATHRRVWVQAHGVPGGSQVLIAGVARQGSDAFGAAFDDLSAAVRAALPPPQREEAASRTASASPASSVRTSAAIKRG